jgi:hypothetical protein
VVEEALPEDLRARYDFLLLPTCACLGEEAAGVLREFASSGGSLVVGFETGLRDGRGYLRDDFLLADLMGASFAGGFTRYPAGYVSAEAGSGVFEGLSQDMQAGPRVGVDVEALPGAEVLARFHLPMESRYMPLSGLGRPAIVRKGRVTSLCGTYFEDYVFYGLGDWRRMVARTVAEGARPLVRFRGLAESVEVSLRDARNGSRVLHLVNSSGAMARPMEKVFTVAGARAEVEVPFRPKKAIAHAAGREIEIDGYDSGFASFGLPGFDEYEMVELCP